MLGALAALAASALLPVGAAEPEVLAGVELPRLRLDPALSFRTASLSAVSTYRPSELVPAHGRRTIAFYDTHLLPRLNGQFQAFRPYENMPEAGQALEEYTLRSQNADSAHASVVRGATKACRDFVVDLLPVDKWISSLPRPSTEIQTSRGSRGGSLDFSFGISHALPEVGVRYRAGNTETRVQIDSFGAVELEFMRTVESWTRVALAYDPESGWYGVHWRLSF